MLMIHFMNVLHPSGLFVNVWVNVDRDMLLNRLTIEPRHDLALFSFLSSHLTGYSCNSRALTHALFHIHSQLSRVPRTGLLRFLSSFRLPDVLDHRDGRRSIRYHLCRV
jgi:hypothetical protein